LQLALLDRARASGTPVRPPARYHRLISPFARQVYWIAKPDTSMIEDTHVRAGVSVTTGSRAWLHGLWLAPFVAAVAPTVLWLVDRYWSRNVWSNVHGAFMPFIFAFLAWQELRKDASEREESSPWGFAFLVPGMALIALDAAIRSQLLSAIGLIVCAPGLSLLLLGARRTRAIAFPLVILFFMLPIPAAFVSTIYLWLREATSIGTTALISLIGIPIARSGTTLFFPGGKVLVADACSGFATLYASAAIALILAHMSSAPARQALLLGLAAPIALAANVIRVTVLTLAVYSYGPRSLETALHEGTGIGAFALALAALFCVAGRKTLLGSRA
jgi:exosortase